MIEANLKAGFTLTVLIPQNGEVQLLSTKVRSQGEIFIEHYVVKLQ